MHGAKVKTYSLCLCFHPLNHNHNKKEAFVCRSVTVFLHAHSNTLYYSNHFQNAIQQPARFKHAPKTCTFHGENDFSKQVK